LEEGGPCPVFLYEIHEMSRHMIEVYQEKHEQARITRAPAKIRAQHSPHHLPDLFFHGGTPSYENARRPEKVNGGERNSTIEKYCQES